MISLQNISKQYSGKYLFRDLSLHIEDGNRIAFVGRNGTGKSTLMKIILGEVETDSGKIIQSRFNSVGYLPQDSVYHAGRTLLEEAATAFDGLNRLHERIREIGVRRATGATKKDIVFQFLAEATFISITGGFIGILLGVIMAKVITATTDILTIVSLWSIVISFGVAASVGIIFGYLPAKKASEQDPVESLRHD